MRWPGVPCHFAFCNLFWVSSWRALRVLGTGIENSWKIGGRGFSKNWFLEPNPVANDLMTPNEEMAGLRYFGVGTSNQREPDRNLTHFALPAPPPYWFIQNKRPNKARTSQDMLKPSRNNSKLRESNTNQKQARPKKKYSRKPPKSVQYKPQTCYNKLETKITSLSLSDLKRGPWRSKRWPIISEKYRSTSSPRFWK